MLATPAEALPPDDGSWAHEFKWDGVRAVVGVGREGVLVQGRSGRDFTSRYPELAGLSAAVGGRRAILDGEVVALDEGGRPSFQVLQKRMHVASPPPHLVAGTPVVYMAFDVLALDDDVLLDRPYEERRSLLSGLELAGAHWQAPPSHPGDGAAVLAAADAQGLEGVVAKRLASVYEPGRRSRAWLKVKSKRRQELVVGGWAEGEGNRQRRIGALLVGHHGEGGLVYAGHVGTGFTEAVLGQLGATLAPLARDTSPFVNRPPRTAGVHWVEPVLVAEVEFTKWTETGTLRHPSFKGLRDDKPASEVVRE